MQFVKQRTLQAIDPVVGFAVSVGLALGGAGYWSLVVGMTAGACASAIAALAASPYRLAFRYDADSAKEYLSFSWPLLVSSIASIVLAQGSVIVGQTALGLAAVGAITLASSVSLFADRIDSIVTETLYPAICAVKDRNDLLFEAFVKSNRLGLMWAVPFGVGLALFAPDLVAFGIGHKWQPAVILLQTFGLTAAAGHVGYNWHAFYRARSTTRPMAVVSVVTMLAFLAAPVPLIFAYGLPGFAVGMGIMTAVMLSVRTFYIMRLFPSYSFFRHAARAIAPSVPAAAVVLGARLLETSHRSLSVALAEVCLYAVVTLAATLVLERRLLGEIMGHLRRRPMSAPGLAA
jgi:lipopolysaccharide exporter